VDPWIGQLVCCGLGWEPVTTDTNFDQLKI
jgi:hypothetical protein